MIFVYLLSYSAAIPNSCKTLLGNLNKNGNAQIAQYGVRLEWVYV